MRMNPRVLIGILVTLIFIASSLFILLKAEPRTISETNSESSIGTNAETSLETSMETRLESEPMVTKPEITKPVKTESEITEPETKPQLFNDYTMTVVTGSTAPIIGKTHEGSTGNEKGYENGHVIKHNGKYHMLITEMFKDGKVGGQGHWSPARIGHWISADGDNWARSGTIVEGNAILSDPKEHTWSPSWYWNEAENHWNIIWRGSNSVFRYKSQQTGEDGIFGPYKEAAQLLPSLRGPTHYWSRNMQSFSNVYEAADGYLYTFIGSVVHDGGLWNWYNGLAFASSIDGPWTRVSNPEPELIYSENPYIIKEVDMYFAVYDDLSYQHSIGYAYSYDGINWIRKTLDLTGHTPWVMQHSLVWTLRTPMSLIKENDGTYTIFFTGYHQMSGYFPIGKISVKIKAEEIDDDKTGLLIPGNIDNLKPNSGTWIPRYGEYLQIATKDSNYNSVIAGRTWDNVIAEAEIRCVESEGKADNWAGLHIRKTKADDGPFDSGYLVYLTSKGEINLYSGPNKLASYYTGIPAYIYRHIKVVADGNNIKVYFNNAESPVIDVNDNKYKSGYVSVNASKSRWHFNNIKVY